MFDIGFTELMLVSVVGLLVIGPERLPQVARTVGRWVSRTRRFVQGARSQFMSELESGDLKKIIGDQREQIDELRNMMADTQRELKDSSKALEQKARDSLGEGEKAVNDAKSRLAGSSLTAAAGALAVGTREAEAENGASDESGTLFPSAGDDPGAVTDEAVYQGPAKGNAADSIDAEQTEPAPAAGGTEVPPVDVAVPSRPAAAKQPGADDVGDAAEDPFAQQEPEPGP